MATRARATARPSAGVAGFADRPIGQLSGGQQQRIFITRALVGSPELLVVDEPISGVDTAGQARFFDLIDQLRRQFKLTIFMVSHQIGQLIGKADFLACLNRTLHWHDTKTTLDIKILEHVYGCELEAYLKTDQQSN